MPARCHPFSSGFLLLGALSTQTQTNARITVYPDGALVYGSAPGVVSARLAASSEPEVALSVRVLGNPVQDGVLRAEVRGAEGQPLHLVPSDARGRVVAQQGLQRAAALETVYFPLSDLPTGVFVLRASIPGQHQTVKVLKMN